MAGMGAVVLWPYSYTSEVRITADNQVQGWVPPGQLTTTLTDEYGNVVGTYRGPRHPGYWTTVGWIGPEVAVGILPFTPGPGGGIGAAVGLGRAGQAAVGIARNAERIESVTGAAYRAPDILNKVAGLIGEVKNVKYLSYTKQLRDYLAFADRQSYKFVLYIRENAQLSVPLKKALNQAKAVVKYFSP